MRFRSVAPWLPTLALLLCLPATATTVYRTVDENGVVSFSDAPPEGEVTVETLEIQAPEASVDPEEARKRLEEMRETTDRMAADRMAREEHRAKMRQMEAEQAARNAPPEYPDYDYMEPTVIYSGYSRRSYQRPWWRHHKPRPEHPIVRPPHRPRPPHNRPPTIQPKLHNDYPASLVRRHYPPKVQAAIRR